jgi:hypothetical protein
MAKLSFRRTQRRFLGLPGHIIRKGPTASRFLDATTPDIEAAARGDGRRAGKAARAVGVPRATLRRWGKAAQARQPKAEDAAQAAMDARTGLGGRRRPPRQSDAVRPQNRRARGARRLRRLRLDGRAHARSAGETRDRPLAPDGAPPRAGTTRPFRLPTALRPPPVDEAQGPTPRRPRAVDLPFVNVRPEKAIKRFTPYDPVAKWTLERVAETPFPIRGVQVDGGSQVKAEFEAERRVR